MNKPIFKVIHEEERNEKGTFLFPKQREAELLERAARLVQDGWEIKGYAIDYGCSYILLQKEAAQ